MKTYCILQGSRAVLSHSISCPRMPPRQKRRCRNIALCSCLAFCDIPASPRVGSGLCPWCRCWHKRPWDPWVRTRSRPATIRSRWISCSWKAENQSGAVLMSVQPINIDSHIYTLNHSLQLPSTESQICLNIFTSNPPKSLVFTLFIFSNWKFVALP